MKTRADYNITDERIDIIRNYIENNYLVTYAEICEDFGWERDTKGGDIKKAQFKVIDAIAEYEKVGKNKGMKYKFLKLKDSIRKEDGRVSIYADNIDVVLMYLLSERMVDGIFDISELSALELAGLVNSNYRSCKREPYIASKILNVDADIMDYVLNREHTKLLSIFESGLNRLSRDGMIMYRKVIFIVEKVAEKDSIDEKGEKIWFDRTRVATDRESIAILDTRNKILIDMKMTMRTAFLTGRLKEVNEKTVKALREKGIDMKYFFKGYHIMASRVGITHKIQKYEALMNKRELNNKIVENHSETFVKEKENERSGKTLKSFKFRKNFVDNAKIVINEVISLDNNDSDLKNKIDNYYRDKNKAKNESEISEDEIDNLIII